MPFLLQQMIVDSIFEESVWSVKIPAEYRVQTIVIKLESTDIEFLTDDETNFDATKLSAYEQLCSAILSLKRSAFLKIAGRTAKDSSVLDRKINNIKSLIMLIKMSQYLTQALCDSEGAAEVILKEYADYLEDGNDQFRVYLLEGQCVGICQKVTNFIGTSPTLNQIGSIKKLSQQIGSILSNNAKSCVIEVYVAPNGKQLKVLSLEPFYIHALSLFTEAQLLNHSSSKKIKPLIKFVEKEEQLKDTDLAEYRIGSQLKEMANVNEWVQFMRKSNNQL